jgi:membrane protein
MPVPGLRGLAAWEVLKCALKEFAADSMSTYAAALAYRALFSLFPFVIFLVALLGFLHVPELFDWLRAQAALLVPAEAMGQVERVIGELQTPQGGLLSGGIVLALWSASIGVQSTMEGLNAAYNVEETRPAWKRYVLAVIYTIAIAALLIAAAAFMAIGPEAAGWVADRIGLGTAFVALWTWLRWPVALVLAMLALSLVYFVAPNVRLPFRLFTPGAVFAVIAWVAASVGFGFYVGHFANYNATYGSLGAIVVLLFYFYVSAAVFLFGAEINAVIDQRSGARER